MMSILCKTQPQFPVQKLPPVFNKRLFKAQAGIVLTDKILYILQRPLSHRRSTEELHTIKPVVSALKDIHKGLQFLKEALCFVVTYEKFDADVDISKKNGEKCLSCYYILNGSVEARYAISNGVFSQGENSPKNPNDCDINYTHVAGEYLGLVSGDGPEFDYPPPDSIRTIEVSEFIRVDREQFHRAVKKVQNKYVREIENFIEEVLALKALPADEKKKLVAMMARQEYPAGKVIVNQGDRPEHLFFVAKGRCQYYRSVFIEEVNREELVKLGQIEKGQFFGESTVLDSIPCFCSVASIGPVTCFLVNNWALKANENIIRILRENRRYFFNDADIKQYIRDSDVWQSFKRCTITELLEMAGKCNTAIDRNEITPILSRAVEYGDAKRISLKIPNHDDEVPGAPKKTEQLFVTPRSSRRRSSAILNCSAAAVVKAVLLLRRSSEDNSDNTTPPSFPSNRSSPFQDLTKFRTAEMFKPKSAPTRRSRKFQEKSKSPTLSRRPKSFKVTKDVLRRPKTTELASANTDQLPRSKVRTAVKTARSHSGKERKEEERGKSKKQNSQTFKRNKSRNFNAFIGTNVNSENTKTPPKEATINMISRADSPGFLPSVAVEKSVAHKPNVVIKEIINTGIPGRRFSPKSYRRFDRSIFDVLEKTSSQDPSSSDEENSGAKSPGLNLWNVSFAASKWMGNVRQRRKSERAQELSDDTGQPPIIVIEDWSPDTGSATEGNDNTDGSQLAPGRKTPTKRTSRTPTPILNDVTEESEEEIRKYEDELAPSERWYTSIHEVHDACKQQLIDFKKDVENLEKQRERLKRQKKKTVSGNEDEPGVEETNEEEIRTSKTEENSISEKVERPATGINVRTRKVSLNAGRRNRSKTFSEVPLEQKRDDQRLRRTQSLGRFRLLSFSTSDEVLRSQSSIGEQWSGVFENEEDIDDTHQQTQHIRVKSSRIERRNQLLRKKMEELEKNIKHTKHCS
ncbi:uncharacterized protein [Porites lutea]|uniref:uncharacterized protein isoform X2 n=1 Tax=Porites lutea TaxID=51062 RepID=UPI003CC513B9